MKEVAKRANISLGTVSNVLNDPSRVSKSTRERVMKAIEETGFVRDTAARQLRGAALRAVGIVVLDSTNPFFTEIIRGAEDALREAGYVLIA
ncbi:regulatory protein, lacI family [Ferrithrix thermotolerans DSM 19514]|uniref:Regulatory protein, lacI family n=2 Tax=Ferrithrix TaxID=643949 RepID=A0A1M4WS89_9ACTN|nr:regulatory protein, lacI family [Ferrithrix thermotolerans DSM 19514]